MRASASRGRTRGRRTASRVAQALLALSLLISLVVPLLPVLPAAAAQPGGPLPPPLPAPARVALSGSFQSVAGCPADFDPSCPQTQLRDNRDGSWSAVIPVPPGDYTFRVVATSDEERALGEGGDPNGADLFLSVPGEATAVYFRYDSLTGEIEAEPVRNAVTLATDLGEEFAMAPARQGGYEVRWDARPGTYGFQILLDGQPVAQDGVSLDAPSRVVVSVDDAGAVTGKDTVQDTRLEVAAVDDAGNPRADACFAIIDGQNEMQAQACDEDDNQIDGRVALRVPDGLDDGQYQLFETATGEGGTPAQEQLLQLGEGRFEAVAQAAAGEAAQPAEEPVQEQPSQGEPAAGPEMGPGEQPGQLRVLPVDDAGQPLPGACFAVVEFGFEACDDDFDGYVVFDAVPSAPLTLRQTAPPAGFAPMADLPFTIEPAGATLTVPLQRAGAEETPAEQPVVEETETPAIQPEEPREPATAGEVALALRDADGAPVTGSCWMLTDRDSGGSAERCDGDDGSDDGAIRFEGIPEGRFRLDETRPPDGFVPAESRGIDVAAGTPAQATIEYQRQREAAQEGPGRLVIIVNDPDGNPMAGTCFDILGPVELRDVCDQQNDGRLNVPDIPSGEYTVIQTRADEGFVPADETRVTVPAGERIDLPLLNRREGAEEGQEATPAGDGQVVATMRQEDGAPVPGACVTLAGAAGDIAVCDEADDDASFELGQIAIAAVPPGEYTLGVEPPDGFAAPNPTRIEVAAGQTASVDIVLPAAPAEPAPEPRNGTLAIVSEDDAGNLLGGACYTIEIPPGGQGFGPFCDDDGNGEVMLEGVSPGPIAVIESTPPSGVDPAAQASQTVEIIGGEETEVVFVHGPAGQEQAAEGRIAVRIVDTSGEPVDGCVNIDGDAETFSVCDGEAEDRDEAEGSLLIDGVIPGRYVLSIFGLPDDLPLPDDREIDVVAGETAEVEFRIGIPAGPAGLVLFVEDEQGQRLGGTCFIIESEAGVIPDVCDQGDDGRLNIPDLPAGSYTIVQTRAADGRQSAPEQTVALEPGQTVEITLLNPLLPVTPTATPAATEAPAATPAPEAAMTPSPVPDATAEQPRPAVGGTFAIVNLAPDNTLIGGGCFSISDAAGTVVVERCDNGPGDFDNTPGVVAFGALPAGAITVTQTRAPEGFTPAAPLLVEHGVNPTAVDLFSEAAEAESGTVELAAFDEEGNPVPGQCYTLSGTAGDFGPYCDDGEGDAAGEPGVLAVEGLPSGTYEAVLQSAGEEADAEFAQQAGQRRSVAVRRGDRPTRANFSVRRQQNRRGDVLIRVRDQDGAYLGGACFALTANGENAPEVEVCDDQNGDRNSSPGRILITGLRAGRSTLTQTVAPNGFAPAADQEVRVQAGSVRQVAVTNEFIRAQTATLDVETIDGEGNLLVGACYAIMLGNSTTEACDADTGNDGITRFADIEAGSYVVRQIQPPEGGFAPARSTATLVESGKTVTVTVVNDRATGSLQIRKSDESGQFLEGVCFALLRDGRDRYTICDNDASDGDPAAGILLLRTVAPGDYLLRETRSPTGYLPSDDQEIAIAPGQRARVTVVNVLAPPPERVGALRIFKVDARDRALAGSCFALIDATGNLVHPTCDGDDGAENGVILMEDVAIGDYTLRETRRPSADFEPAADQEVTIVENQTVDVAVQNRLRTGNLLIRKTNRSGAPLAGACFDLLEDGAGAACTDANGELLFSGLAPGVYRIIETEAPPGYLVVPGISPVTVRPGSTATLDVVDEPAPPPPDSGSLQVVKFVCPAAPGDGGIVFVDSSDPDGGGLARTAGCDRGDAAFAIDGPSGPTEFRTRESGRFQTTLPTGDYVLTELSTGAFEPFVISLNTLTTIVVVNYVEPEGEEPAAIDVLAYTCEPGFQGRVWADFASACQSAQNLTNDVTFRLSGMVAARRVTGDGGIGGQTRFDGLPPGDYRLRIETPAGIVATYAFCGVDPAAPSGRAVGDAVALRLAVGQAVTCHWFNVPEDLAGGAGAITVYKYACPVTTPSASYDWFGRCDPQGQGVRFSLSRWDGSTLTPVTVGATDSDGILRLTRLQPGTYDLQEVDAAWCHAESDSVNADGRVVVEAGSRASVWIFNCVGAKNPPNTGAGPMWSGAVPAAASSLGVGLGLLWPLIGLVALRRRAA